MKEADFVEEVEEVQGEVELALLQLKEQALEATKRADAQFYENYLSDEAIAIVPFGIFDKKAIVQLMSSTRSPFKNSRIEYTKAIALSPESGIVTYKAIYEREGSRTLLEVFVTTVYAKIDGVWKGVFYQQTLTD